MKYHINAKGNPGLCKALMQCPFGGDDHHYPSADNARKAFELSMGGAAGAEKEAAKANAAKAREARTSLQQLYLTLTPAARPKISAAARSSVAQDMQAMDDKARAQVIDDAARADSIAISSWQRSLTGKLSEQESIEPAVYARLTHLAVCEGAEEFRDYREDPKIYKDFPAPQVREGNPRELYDRGVDELSTLVALDSAIKDRKSLKTVAEANGVTVGKAQEVLAAFASDARRFTPEKPTLAQLAENPRAEDSDGRTIGGWRKLNLERSHGEVGTETVLKNFAAYAHAYMPR